MTQDEQDHRSDARLPPETGRHAQAVALTCALFAAVIAAVSLLGWTTRLDALKNLTVGGVFMNPLTAILVVTMSLILVLSSRSIDRRFAWGVTVLCLFVIVVTLTKLASVWISGLPAFDRILFRSQLGTNQMAPNTALGLLLLACGFLSGHIAPRFDRLQRTFIILAASLSGLSILGYLYAARPLYGVGEFIPMAFNTALALGVISVGAGALTRRGRWVDQLVERSSAGLLMRSILPAAILIPAFLGWLRLLGSRAGLYSHEIGVALFVVATSTIFIALALWIVRSIELLEENRSRAEIMGQEKVKLETQIIERERANQLLIALNRELAAARDAAVEASRLKSAILANVSHELRTPLTVILGYVGLLRQAPAADEETGRMLQTLEESARRLHLLIDDFIALASIEAGVTELVREQFEIRPALEKAVQDAMADLTLNGNDVHFDFDRTHGTIDTDRSKLARALKQLLDNAGKFTSRGRISIRAEVRTEKDHPLLQIEVEDTGIGIAPKQLDRLFQPFTQLDDSPSRAYGGVGLGLVLSKRLCHILGGDLRVQSEPGSGSCFTMRIPLAASRVIVRP